MEGCRAIPGRGRVAPVLLLVGIVPQTCDAFEEGPYLLDALHFCFRVCHRGAVIREEGQSSRG
eukprot:14145220-Alexandrium_andersonii.AAC.1